MVKPQDRSLVRNLWKDKYGLSVEGLGCAWQTVEHERGNRSNTGVVKVSYCVTGLDGQALLRQSAQPLSSHGQLSD